MGTCYIAPMTITFDVADVPCSVARLSRVTVEKAVRSRLASTSEAQAANLDNLVETDVHPFVNAAHLAFEEHLPLTLSPDDVWLCIAQGFAQHVDLNAEALRGRFVRHAGKANIVVVRNEFIKGSAQNDWPGVFGEFSDGIANHIGKQRDLIVADFSTTGAIERAASEVVLMSAMRHYFEYILVTRCGIPRITLLGTPEDWLAIKRRAEVLAEYGLEHWVSELAPILAEMCAAAAGSPDRTMWQSFYKYESRSGGDSVTGWINVLFPYLRQQGSELLVANPFLTAWRRHGPTPAAFPGGMSIAPFTWDYLGTKLAMEFAAGFVAVSQDPASLGVRPAIGWAVRDAAKPSS